MGGGYAASQGGYGGAGGRGGGGMGDIQQKHWKTMLKPCSLIVEIDLI